MSKSLSTVIATILMVFITISLVGVTYLYISGILTGITSQVLEVISFNKGSIFVRNTGTDSISKDNIRVLVEGEEVSIKSDKDPIQPSDTATLTILDAYKYDGVNMVIVIPGTRFTGDFGKNWPEGIANWLFKVGKSS